MASCRGIRQRTAVLLLFRTVKLSWGFCIGCNLQDDSLVTSYNIYFAKVRWVQPELPQQRCRANMVLRSIPQRRMFLYCQGHDLAPSAEKHHACSMSQFPLGRQVVLANTTECKWEASTWHWGSLFQLQGCTAGKWVNGQVDKFGVTLRRRMVSCREYVHFQVVAPKVALISGVSGPQRLTPHCGLLTPRPASGFGVLRIAVSFRSLLGLTLVSLITRL